MTKENLKELFDVMAQVLPFFMLAAVFLGFAYTYGHTQLVCHEENISQLLRLSCNCLP